MRLEVFPLNSSRKEDFYKVHSELYGAGICYCVAWWIPTWNGWEQRTAQENKIFREKLFDTEQYDGYLLYVEGEPSGWCQCCSRDRLTKLCRQYHLKSAPETWVISCFLLVPDYHGMGISLQFLLKVLEDLQTKGVEHVQSFPRTGRNPRLEDLWTGPESIFIKAGFKMERHDPEFPIYGKWLIEKKKTQYPSDFSDRQDPGCSRCK